jgi:pyruvate dehydrogenase E2 component (dihydrolipoamide acetyltransferase)
MDVLMPQLGETVSSGKIISWFKKVGDKVAPGEDLFEIETDKTSMEVPATVSGTLAEIRVGDGIEAPVGAVVAIIRDEGAMAAPRHELAQGVEPLTRLDPFNEVRTPRGNYGPARLASGICVTPLARRLAREYGVDLAAIAGSGPRDRIVKADIERARSLVAEVPAPAATQSGGYTETPLTNIRKIIAQRLTEAKQTIPHFYLTTDVAIDKLLALRTEINSSLAAQKIDAKISVNDFAIRGVAIALRQVPAVNATFTATAIRQYRDVDVSVAVATNDGLITPIIRRADTKTLLQVSTEMKSLVARARDGKLRPEEFQGGGFSISNLGMYGVKQFQAVINPPQACILAIGAGERRAVARGEILGVATLMTCTLSVDHRVVDGALGGRFLQAFKASLEDPISLLV